MSYFNIAKELFQKSLDRPGAGMVLYEHHEETTDYIDYTAHTDTFCLCPTANGQ